MKVSIIIPTYKRTKTLNRAILSAFNQTYKNIEIIVIDDNDPQSADRFATESIVEQYKEGKNFIYIKHQKNRNGAAARNTGIINSSGDIICFLDDDDWYHPQKTYKQVKYLLSNKEYQGVYCGVYNNNKQVISSYTGDLTKQLLLLQTCLYTPTLMFYKSCILDIGCFNENFGRHQDYDLLLKYFRKYKIGVVRSCLVYLGTNAGENNLHGKRLNDLKVYFFKEFSTTINNIEDYEKGYKNRVLSAHYSAVFLDHIKNKHYIMAVKLLTKYTIKFPIVFCSAIIKRIRLLYKSRSR